MHIPATIDEVTAEWLADVTQLDITGVESEIIGVGIGVSSAVYRLTLTGNEVPASLVLKRRHQSWRGCPSRGPTVRALPRAPSHARDRRRGR